MHDRLWTDDECLKCINLCLSISNIDSISHCVTRLRLLLKSLNGVDIEALKKLPNVKGVLIRGNEVQLVMGLISISICDKINKIL